MICEQGSVKKPNEKLTDCDDGLARHVEVVRFDQITGSHGDRPDP